LLFARSKEFDIAAEHTLIAFEGKDVVGLLVQNLAGYGALAAHGIDGDDGALNGQHVQQLGNGDDLIGLVRHLDLPQHQALRAAKAETMWIGSSLARDPLERRTVLPSMATTPSGTPASDATQAAKQRWNCSASRLARVSPR